MPVTESCRIIRLLPALLLFFALPVSAFEPPEPEDLDAAEDLRYYTEQYPPYNYMENGELKGLMMDTWEEVWARMGADLSRDDVIHAPWARGYHELQTWPGTALAVMTYTEDRAEYMKFMGPLVDVRFVIFARAEDDIEIDALDDIRDYTVGTVRDDIGEQLLVDQGFEVSEFERLTGPAEAAKLLDAGRIDLWTYQEDVALFEIGQAGLDPDDFEPVYVTEEGTLMAAFHIDTPQDLVDEFQAAFDDARADGTMDAIIDRHLER